MSVITTTAISIVLVLMGVFALLMVVLLLTTPSDQPLRRGVVHHPRPARRHGVVLRHRVPAVPSVLERTWRHYTDLDADLHRRILDTETDWDVMFDRPMLRDVSAPVTQALFRAQLAVDLMADSLKEVPSGLTVADDVTAQPYVKAVMALSHAWEEAWHESGRAGDHYLPERERRTLARIKQVIARIEDSGVGDAERASAYRALSGLVGELEHVEAAPRMLNQIETARSTLPDRLLPQKVEVAA